MHLQPRSGEGRSARDDGTGIVDANPEETHMPDISLPEVHLPEIKLPSGLRDMTRKDIQSALNDRIPSRIEMPDVDLSNIQLPKAVEDRLKTVEKRLDSIDLSKVELPRAIESRLPRKRRSNPVLPVAALLAVTSAIAAAWWLITSPGATMRVRQTADRAWRKVTGQETALMRYDDDNDLASLVPNPSQTEVTRPSAESDAWPDTFSDLGETVSAGNGSSTETTSSSSSILSPDDPDRAVI
jgi:hypothetical protein